MSWKSEVKVGGSWSSNACRFATEKEAIEAGDELLSRWFAPSDHRAVETTDPVNYQMVDGRPQPIQSQPTEAAAT